MSKYYILSYGLGGGFGGASSHAVERHETEQEAYESARRYSIEEYESYEGLHGLDSIDDIIEELDCDEEEAQIEYNDRMDSWLDYDIEIFTKKRALELDDELEYFDGDKDKLLGENPC